MAVALGVVSTIFDFAFFAYFKQFGESELQTMWFIGSILTELILFYSIRTSLPWWRAKSPGIGGVLLTVGVMVVTVAVPFIPWAQELFRFSEPSMVHLGIAITLVGMYFVSTEIAKLLYVRTHREPVVPGVHFRARM
jgi:Mg2+-importing ATPase